MNIHEYQAKALFREYGVAVPAGVPAFSPEEARAAAEKLGSAVTVIKAQVHAGGRGKAGGVKIAKSPAEAEQYAKGLIGMVLHTKQTGSEGKLVRKLLVEEGTDIAKEFYLSLSIDSASECAILVLSEAGGMDIEEVAASEPEKIVRVSVDPEIGLRPYQLYTAAETIRIPAGQKRQFVAMVSALYRLFTEKDCAMVEVNPLALTGQGTLLALDAKIDFDSGALFRHPDIAALRDRDEEPPLEARAFDSGLNYVSLDGNIGCLVVGAGLAMATMDAVKAHGGQPGNFLDCGSSSRPEDAKEAFAIILEEKGIEGILVNIFGGITQTDRIAEGIITAMREYETTLPVVVRLEGNNCAEANRMLLDSGLNVELAGSLTEGVEKILHAVRRQKEFRA